MLLGVLLAQAAWIVAVPPFRGIDEFDHVFRAAGVASGQYRLDEEAAGGRGLLVDVPADLVAASEGQCRGLPYIESETCDGDGPGPDGTVRATTSAANYLPAYYWVVGKAAQPFEGAHALYAMRITSALMSALVVALAVLCLGTWARGPWAVVGLLVGLSPTLIYTTTVVAPNGLEMAAGLLLWTSLLGLGPSAEVDVGRERRLLAAATLALVLLCGLRSLGPLIVVLVLLSVVALRGFRPLLAVVGRHRLHVVLAVLLAVVTVAGVFLWNRDNIAFADGELNDDIDSSWTQAIRWPTWILTSIAAFPFRDQPAPLMVYVLVLLVMVTMIVVAIRRGEGTERRAAYVAPLLTLLVPSVLVALTLEERGGVWQGRYLLPFMVGVMVLLGLVIDRHDWRRPPLLALVMLALAHVVSVVHVQLAELDRPVSADDPGWANPPTVVTGLVMALGWVAFAAAVRAVPEVPAVPAEREPSNP